VPESDPAGAVAVPPELDPPEEVPPPDVEPGEVVDPPEVVDDGAGVWDWKVSEEAGSPRSWTPP
jgi:hypothetical protein